jgi:hypothetical protein
MELLETENQSEPMALIIAGMHRSGTSLAASLLQSAGVDVGKRLMGAGSGNIKGHFENLDFVDFHREVLRSQGAEDAGWTLQEQLKVNQQQTQLAKQIVAQNISSPIWGWKDPRTTLFLDFWAELLPEAKFLLLFRSPWEVVDSLLRRSIRDLDLFLKTPDLAIKLWIHYNRKILNFYQQNPQKSILIGTKMLTENPNWMFSQLHEKFGLKLAQPDVNLYEKSLLHTEDLLSYKSSIIFFHAPEAVEIYKDLLIHEAQSNAQEPELDKLNSHSTTNAAWVFEGWLENLQLNHQCKDLQSKLTATQLDLQQKNTELQIVHTKLQVVHTELQVVHTELHQKQIELAAKNTELHEVHSTLQATQAVIENQQQAIQQLQVGLQSAKTLIAAMESSKFWQMRQAWFRFKERFRFGHDR